MSNEEHKLTVRQEAFCIDYTKRGNTFGNGTMAYAEAYNKDLSNAGTYAVCRAQASILLTNPNILERVRELLDLDPLNNETVDKELAFVIQQNSEMAPKVSAIKEYNALKARIKNKLEVNVNNLADLLKGNDDTNGTSRQNKE